MMAPASVIDYLIVHELCHFKYKRHNAEFWNDADKYYPEYQKQVSWLKVYGATLVRYEGSGGYLYWLETTIVSPCGALGLRRYGSFPESLRCNIKISLPNRGACQSQ
jgi:hypothetical protein